MRNVLSAELFKLLPHRGTWLLVWIYPIIFLVLLTIGQIVDPGPSKQAVTATGYLAETAVIWELPGITLGRYFIAAYLALVFAGEYGWNTWKLIVPHAARWKLIASKYVVALGLLYVAWAGAAVISTVMQYIGSAIVGVDAPKGVTFTAILDAQWSGIVRGLAPLLLTAAYASLAAVLTRSTLAAFIISLVLITLDELFGPFVRWFSSGGSEWLVGVYRVLPGYHLQNLASWLGEGVGFQMKLASGTAVAYSQTTSLLVLAGWIVGLIASVFAVFRRQDIN